MPTTTVKTIGTGGDYTTLQAWENACPADLVAADEIWQGQVKNQEFVGTSTLLTVSGQTTDATRYVELTTEAGASFVDNANKLTNALRYNASNGAAIRQGTGYGGAAAVFNTAFTRVSKLQFAATQNIDKGVTVGGASVAVDQCIMLGRHVGMEVTASSVIARNSLFISSVAPRNDSGALVVVSGSVTAYNCTGVTYSGGSPAGLSSAFRNAYATMLLRNCAGFGFPYFTRVTALSGSCSNNASDQTIAAGTANQQSLTYADQFENTTSGAADFRIKTGATLINNGADLSGVGITTDIIGTSRVGTYDIGAWEIPPLTSTITAGTLSLTASATAEWAATPEPDTGARGGGDAWRDDVVRLSRRERRLRRQEEERAARLREALERAHRAAAAAQPAQRAAISAIPSAAGMAETLDAIDRVLRDIQQRRSVVSRDDDDLAVLLSVF